jgi:hypothetical protein
MASYDDFWGRMKQAGPGLIDLGLGLYGRNAANSEMDQRRQRVEGGLFKQANDLAGSQLARGGNFDPRAAGQERFNAAQGMLRGVDEKALADLMRYQHGKGTSGLATYNPGVEGITPNGTAMNPQLAAYYAGKGARDSKMAYDALGQGEAQLDSILKRAGMLQGAAGNAQSTGMRGEALRPSRAMQNMELLKKGAGLLGNEKVFGQGGLFGKGIDWLKDSFDFSDLGFDIGFGDWWN